MNLPTKPPVWINIPDLIVQVAIPMYAFSTAEVFTGGYLYACMFGGPWQLFSHFIHRVLGFSYQKKSFRSLHGLWASITLLTLLVGFAINIAWSSSTLIIFIAGLRIHSILPKVALIMGGILYIFYMLICLQELLINKRLDNLDSY